MEPENISHGFGGLPSPQQGTYGDGALPADPATVPAAGEAEFQIKELNTDPR